ncbi:MAG: TetR/AcrR family transcriptional regulator [Acidimicrobiia bacterium]|nr:TetR/AcrR family transcriptional regulator [Acidimicrobiia bacterium]
MSTARPRGPVAVSQALVEACERLCSAQPPGSVTVRSIAEAADVNHGLVHQYFSSKIELLGATMLHVEQIVGAELGSVNEAGAAAEAFVGLVLARPSYPRLLTWMLLEGIDPTEHVDDFPLVSRLVELVSVDVPIDEARMRVALLLAFVAGLATTAYFVADVTELPSTERARMESRAGRVARGIVSPGSDVHVG